MEMEAVLTDVMEETNGNETKDTNVEVQESKEEMTNGSNGNHDKGRFRTQLLWARFPVFPMRSHQFQVAALVPDKNLDHFIKQKSLPIDQNILAQHPRLVLPPGGDGSPLFSEENFNLAKVNQAT